MDGDERRVRQRHEDNAPGDEGDAAFAEDGDEEGIQWGRADGDDLAFWPQNQDEEEALEIQRRAIVRVVRNVYTGEQSIADVLRVTEDMHDKLDFFASPMQIVSTGWTCHSLFGLCLWALPIGKLGDLLRDLERRDPDVWSTRLGAEQETLLRLAAREHPPLSVIRLIAAKEEGKLIGDRYGRLPMHAVCSNGALTTDYVTTLLDTRREALRHSDVDGLLPLHVALRTTARANGQATVEQIDAIRWMVRCYPEAQTSPDHQNKTPLMLALQECGSSTAWNSPVVMGLFIELVNETRGSLRSTRLVNGVEDVLSTALHAVAEAQFVSKALVRFVLTEDNDSLQVQDWSGDLPLHKICTKFVEFDGVNDILRVVHTFLDRYGDGLETRNVDGLTPLHVAIRSWGLAQQRDYHAPVEELLSLIRMATPATVRGTDRRSRGTPSSGSCLQYAYGNISDVEILATLFKISPMESLLMDDVAVQNGYVNWFRRQADEAFLAVLEIMLHPTGKDLVSETKRQEIREFLSQVFPHLADASPHGISCTISQRVVGRDLRNIREFLMDDQNVKDLLYNDLGPGGSHLADMVRGLLNGNRAGRLRQPIDMFDSDDHMRLLFVMNSDMSAVYLHLHDCVSYMGSLDFTGSA
jgi:ankyrin repeat protein